jgi:diadenosine tetraphosphatase ApaH/serine/threonine PP2A family protein phosphatase
MRLGILGDVHGNLEALEATSSAMLEEGVDHILQVGDLVGYGAEPGECIDRIRDLGCTVCRGNHDDAVIGVMDPSYFNHYARAAIEWTYDKISSDHIKYLNSLPYVIEHDLYSLVHGTLFMPKQFGYIQSEVEARQCLSLQKTFMCFVGHSHKPSVHFVPIDQEPNREVTFVAGETTRKNYCEKVLVNVGSVGQPRDEDPRAAYVIYDSESRWVAIRRVAYDIARTQKKILAAGLPSVLAERLALGV